MTDQATGPDTVETLIIGGSLLGCAVAYYLAREGAGDILIAEADVHGVGAIAGSYGNVRQQFGTPLEIECSRRGLEFWKNIDRDFGIPVPFHEDGYLMVTADSDTAALLHRHAEVQRECDMPDVELLDAAEIAELSPFLNVDGLICGSYTPHDGHIMGTDGITAYLAGAREIGGVRVRQHCPISRVQRAGDQWRALTPDGEILAQRVIVTAGGGTPALLAPFGIDLDLTSVKQYSLLSEEAFVGQRLPFTVDLDCGLAVERDGDKLMFGMLGRNPAPSGYDELMDQFYAAAAFRAPVLQSLGISHRITASPTVGGDGHPYIGQVEENMWTIAFAGHGVMHGPPVAEALAREIAGRPDATLDLSPWDLRRTVGSPTVLWRRHATN
jgi:sarcosine oxidase subunit beta